MSEAIQLWHTEHEYFARLLDALERQIKAFQAAESPDYQLMRDIIFYLHHYSDRFHHPREDAVFERVAERDPSLRVDVDALRKQHQTLAKSGAQLHTLLEEVEGGALLPRDKVRTAAKAYLSQYRKHIETEENGIMQRADELLTAEDWQSSTLAAHNEPDPLFGPNPAERFRELRRQLALESQGD
ncbi:MAG: hemerythrin domain-containing protein [Burkholderiales bacterium]|nr:MAG: hemerythrin domain-containing protein [Burkholderiales bacterium]